MLTNGEVSRELRRDILTGQNANKYDNHQVYFSRSGSLTNSSIDESRAAAHNSLVKSSRTITLQRAVALMLLALGFALGSVIGIAESTNQAFADPCPMNHQSGDCPCCDDGCTGAMIGCAAKCAVSFGTVALPTVLTLVYVEKAPSFAFESDTYSPLSSGPAPPIPIV